MKPTPRAAGAFCAIGHAFIDLLPHLVIHEVMYSTNESREPISPRVIQDDDEYRHLIDHG